MKAQNKQNTHTHRERQRKAKGRYKLIDPNVPGDR